MPLALKIDWQSVWEIIELPVRLLFLVVLGLIVRHFLHWLINALAARASGEKPPDKLFGSKALARLLRKHERARLRSARAAQRANALASLFKSITTAVVATVVVLVALSELDYNLTPLLASAGVLGAALGFGAQSLVKDFLAGVCMLIEDQYGVGDVVDMGEAVGTVEGVGLRVTRIRGYDGVLWHVRNGEVIRVGNRTQGWSRLWLEATVAYGEDLARVEQLIQKTIDDLVEDEQWRDRILEKPSVLGVDDVNGLSVTFRVFGKCAPEQQYGVQRELRERLKVAFDEAGVKVPPPIWPGQHTAAL